MTSRKQPPTEWETLDRKILDRSNRYMRSQLYCFVNGEDGRYARLPKEEKIAEIRKLVGRCNTKFDLDDNDADLYPYTGKPTAFFVVWVKEKDPQCLLEIMKIFWNKYKEIAEIEKFELSRVILDWNKSHISHWNPLASLVKLGDAAMIKCVLEFYKDARILHIYGPIFARQLAFIRKHYGSEHKKLTDLAGRAICEYLNDNPRQYDPADTKRPVRRRAEEAIVIPDNSATLERPTESSCTKKRKVSSIVRDRRHSPSIKGKVSHQKSNETVPAHETAAAAAPSENDGQLNETNGETFNGETSGHGANASSGSSDRCQDNSGNKDVEMKDFLTKCLTTVLQILAEPDTTQSTVVQLTQLIPELKQNISNLAKP